MSRQTTGQLSVYTIDGASLITTVRSVEYDANFDLVGGRPITRLGESNQAVKAGITIRTGLLSDVSAPVRVSNLNVTGLTIDAVEYSTLLRGGSFNGSFDVVEASAVKDWFKFPMIVKKDYEAMANLMLPTSLASAINASTNIGVALHSGAPADLSMVWSITINAQAYTLPMVISKAVHKFNEGDLAMYEVSLKGQDPHTGNYPTAPTGTTGLLQKALNAPETALAFVLTSHASEGISYAGNMVISDFRFSFEDAQLVLTDYTYVTQGTVTATPN